ncbi:hypothetical protein BDV09DRAFT_180467 [Aspergillus tetrazonus]|uniref:Uncharacterized protein n=1 Tax=Emericella nidulans (strain FGSC A4 / ATCC 38163 / CBS 112.46 / NRRL 194 / M139) TaxID=227321 RepID=Q5AT97_EMENI|nr:hypothetical protein [Aspergillus nidulans FGSC A4]EAA67105.1 hypothetical protein AN8483.2 [Aspergillus nidulans FGSC A4]CBF80643.1 TPA: conserved hypothetical protein [Aspergillus nidulans FGSC A4]|eukprot:XP_681752.1 hypothetical protein AN8483.2 [Aspergillus nidulans FGSC A4]
MSAPQVVQSLSSASGPAGGWFRTQLATLRNRFINTEKRRQRAALIGTSFAAHRPVWITAGGGAYTTAVAVYLTMKLMRRIPV